MKKGILIVVIFLFFALSIYAQNKAPEGFVLIKGGTFTMGSPANELEREKNEVQHQVTVSSFYMGKYEVTQKEYMEIMETNPSKFKGDNLPVEQVTWYDAVEYCNKRSQKEGFTPAYKINGSGYSMSVTWNRSANGYRLPTEAEWEYACRAGTTTPFSTGNNITTEQANYNGEKPYNNNAKGKNLEKTTSVGSYKPNPWGLHDMHGNVYEWCWSIFGGYSTNAQTDPEGPNAYGDSSTRVLRGGAWSYEGKYLRSACPNVGIPFFKVSSIGFRVVRPE